jgi:hypothetical protein
MREWRYNSIHNLWTRWRWMVSFKPWPLYWRGRSPLYPLDRRLGGPHLRSGRGGEEAKSPSLPGIEPCSSSPYPSHYSDLAIPAPSSHRLKHFLGVLPMNWDSLSFLNLLPKCKALSHVSRTTQSHNVTMKESVDVSYRSKFGQSKKWTIFCGSLQYCYHFTSKWDVTVSAKYFHLYQEIWVPVNLLHWVVFLSHSRQIIPKSPLLSTTNHLSVLQKTLYSLCGSISKDTTFMNEIRKATLTTSCSKYPWILLVTSIKKTGSSLVP